MTGSVSPDAMTGRDYGGCREPTFINSCSMRATGFSSFNWGMRYRLPLALGVVVLAWGLALAAGLSAGTRDRMLRLAGTVAALAALDMLVARPLGGEGARWCVQGVVARMRCDVLVLRIAVMSSCIPTCILASGVKVLMHVTGKFTLAGYGPSTLVCGRERELNEDARIFFTSLASTMRLSREWSDNPWPMPFVPCLIHTGSHFAYLPLLFPA